MVERGKFRILIVDDVLENIQVLAEALSTTHKVLVATDGFRALEIAGRLESPPDLILLDIMMPGMDGFEVCRRLKELPATSEIPVIFVTAKDAVEDEAQGLSLGAVDYVTKPFQLPIVLARIHNHLLRKRAEEERLELERRLHQYRQVESLGVMAGGIAHDFNNLLTVIMGNLELLQSQRSLADDHVAMIDAALTACHTASTLTRQILYFVGKGQFRSQEIDLGKLLLDNRHLLESALPPNVHLNLDVVAGLPNILGDELQLRQLTFSLVTNAVEAIGSKDGLVTIVTGVEEYDEEALSASRLPEKPPPGRFVKFEVKDTGCGMDEETQRCLFDPFFSTKFVGRGVGMSAVLGIVRAHLGAIFVESAVGQGTTIRVLFPISGPGTVDRAGQVGGLKSI